MTVVYRKVFPFLAVFCRILSCKDRQNDAIIVLSFVRFPDEKIEY